MGVFIHDRAVVLNLALASRAGAASGAIGNLLFFDAFSLFESLVSLREMLRWRL